MIIDHSGNLLLLDAVTTTSGIHQWLSADGVSPFTVRQMFDVKQSLTLVTIACLDVSPRLGERILRDCRMIAQTHLGHSSEMIGEVLMQFADVAGSTFGAEETCVNSSSKHNGSRNVQSWIEDLSS